jgi:spore coat protein CotH
LLLTASALALALGGCSLFGGGSSSSKSGSGASSDVDSSSAGSGSGSDSGSSDSSDQPSSLNYVDFWDGYEVTDLKLSFTNESLYKLSYFGAKDNQKWGDVYFPADLSLKVKGVTYSYKEVGVRMKGNTSRSEFVNEDGSFMDGKCAHLKISLKATFDDAAYYDMNDFKSFKHDWTNDAAGRKARKSRSLSGMEKFDLKYLPRNTSSGGVTYSQEMYCYKKFNDNGIMAPHDRWASVTLSDPKASRTGYFEFIEDIDKAFLKNRLGSAEAQGDLYKCVWGIPKDSSSWQGATLNRDGAVDKTFDSVTGYCNGARLAYGRIGVEDNFNNYHPNYQLKTNDNGEASDFSKMANFINVVHSCRYENAPFSLLSGVLDIDEFLKFDALGYLFGNFDDHRMNYNNYFLYFRPSDGKAIYIPYDWDWSLGNANGQDLSSLSPFYTADLDGSENKNNLYWDTILTGSSNDAKYAVTDIRAAYAEDLKNLLSVGVLDKANYVSFVASFPKKDEVSSVSNFMDARSTYLNNLLK